MLRLSSMIETNRENHQWLEMVISSIFEHAPPSSVMENKYITAGLARYQ